jgi:hypothetical protein
MLADAEKRMKSFENFNYGHARREFGRSAWMYVFSSWYAYWASKKKNYLLSLDNTYDDYNQLDAVIKNTLEKVKQVGLDCTLAFNNNLADKHSPLEFIAIEPKIVFTAEITEDMMAQNEAESDSDAWISGGRNMRNIFGHTHVGNLHSNFVVANDAYGQYITVDDNANAWTARIPANEMIQTAIANNAPFHPIVTTTPLVNIALEA